MSYVVKKENLTAVQHARGMDGYVQHGIKRAMSLGNNGPIVVAKDGSVSAEILDSYWQHGFYVLKNVIGTEELSELRSDVHRVLEEAPDTPDTEETERDEPEAGAGFTLPSYRFARPLSDPLGGTKRNKGRHPVKMADPTPCDDAPEWILELLLGNLQLMDSCLRLYGHPMLLAVAEAVNGPDFVPYNEVTFLKDPGLGPSVAWHQDGTTHWGSSDWDEGAHGFNFMTQLYPSTAGNGVWVLPGSHKLGKVDIRQKVEESGSERIEGAVPMICDSGDVVISNRQLVHGSFANSSSHRRVTLNAGFFPRDRVLGVNASRLDGRVETYSEDRIYERSRIIALAIDARGQHFPYETPYIYQHNQTSFLDKKHYHSYQHY